MATGSSSTIPRRRLDEAHAAIERHAPRFVSRMLRWIRQPGRRKLRLGLGMAFVALGMAGPLLPVAGVWMIPVGLLLLAGDAPGCRRPSRN